MLSGYSAVFIFAKPAQPSAPVGNVNVVPSTVAPPNASVNAAAFGSAASVSVWLPTPSQTSRPATVQ